MPLNVVKTSRDEHKWKRAEEIAAKAGREGDYAYVMGIYKKMKPDYKFKKEAASQKKTAIIIKGNPAHLKKHKKESAVFYRDIAKFMRSRGYSVRYNSGKPHTSPPKADLWIGHSRGADRLQYAPKGTKTIAFGSPIYKSDTFKTVNHPSDAKRLRKWKKGDRADPDETHFLFTNSMQKELSKIASVEYRGRTFPGYNIPIKSDKPNKKKMVLVKRGDKVKLVHFGHSSYKHNYSEKAKSNYLSRSAGIRNKEGKLTKNDPFSPNYWARKVLWPKGQEADGSALKKTAAASYLGEGLILKIRGEKGLKLAKKYKNLNSKRVAKVLGYEVPGTKGIHLPGFKNPKTRKMIIEHLSHPETAVQFATPLWSIHLPLSIAAKSKMKGVPEVEQAIKRRVRKKRIRRLLQDAGLATSAIGTGVGTSLFLSRHKKTANVSEHAAALGPVDVPEQPDLDEDGKPELTKEQYQYLLSRSINKPKNKKFDLSKIKFKEKILEKKAGHVEDRAKERTDFTDLEIEEAKKLVKEYRKKLKKGKSYSIKHPGRGSFIVGDVGKKKSHHVIKTVLSNKMKGPSDLIPTKKRSQMKKVASKEKKEKPDILKALPGMGAAVGAGVGYKNPELFNPKALFPGIKNIKGRRAKMLSGVLGSGTMATTAWLPSAMKDSYDETKKLVSKKPTKKSFKKKASITYPKALIIKVAAVGPVSSTTKDFIAGMDPTGSFTGGYGIAAEKAGLSEREHRKKKTLAQVGGAVGSGAALPMTVAGVMKGVTEAGRTKGPLASRLGAGLKGFYEGALSVPQSISRGFKVRGIAGRASQGGGTLSLNPAEQKTVREMINSLEVGDLLSKGKSELGIIDKVQLLRGKMTKNTGKVIKEKADTGLKGAIGGLALGGAVGGIGAGIQYDKGRKAYRDIKGDT